MFKTKKIEPLKQKMEVDTTVGKLAVKEMFSHGLQGEGSNMGCPCIFLRLHISGMGCLKKTEEYECLSYQEVYDRIRGMTEDSGIRHIVINGEEPLNQQNSLAKLFELLRAKKYYCEVETSGLVKPGVDIKASQYNVNYNIDDDMEKTIKFFLKEWSIFKFKVKTKNDFNRGVEIVKQYKIPKTRVFFVPNTTKRLNLNRISRRIAMLCARQGYNFSYRLQVALFNKKEMPYAK